MRASNFTVPTMPTLRPKLRKVPRRSLSMAVALDCSSLRWVRSIRSFWLRNVFTCTRRQSPPHHLGHAARIVAVRLLICAFNAARMCRVSTQITGKPASASALNSHCDRGPASNPMRLKR